MFSYLECSNDFVSVVAWQLPCLISGGVEPSSPGGPQFEDEADLLLGNDADDLGEEEEGEELFGDNFERWEMAP